MKNTTSLFLTLISYVVTLATILFLLFAAMPAPLKAQTNLAAGTEMTNAATTNTAVPATIVATPADAKPPLIAMLPATLALLIPIVGIVMGCIIPIVIVGLLFYFRHRKNQMVHETVRAMVDKGVPIPPALFAAPENISKRPRNDLRTGLILTSVGIGIVLFLGKPGWIVLFLGVAFLVMAGLEKKNKNDDQPPKA